MKSLDANVLSMWDGGLGLVAAADQSKNVVKRELVIGSSPQSRSVLQAHRLIDEQESVVRDMVLEWGKMDEKCKCRCKRIRLGRYLRHHRLLQQQQLRR